MKLDKKNLGIWGIACIQHCFINKKSLTDKNYKIPSTNGLRIYEAIQKFLHDPTNPPWLLDQALWPTANVGCNGLSSNNLIS